MATSPSFDAARRRVLSLLGFGAAGAALSVVASDKVFAKQFCGEVTAGSQPPQMVYDPKLQMMVDPSTRKPIYLDSQKVATINATVTAGCSNCPKCDDACV